MKANQIPMERWHSSEFRATDEPVDSISPYLVNERRRGHQSIHLSFQRSATPCLHIFVFAPLIFGYVCLDLSFSKFVFSFVESG